MGSKSLPTSVKLLGRVAALAVLGLVVLLLLKVMFVVAALALVGYGTYRVLRFVMNDQRPYWRGLPGRVKRLGGRAARVLLWTADQLWADALRLGRFAGRLVTRDKVRAGGEKACEGVQQAAEWVGAEAGAGARCVGRAAGEVVRRRWVWLETVSGAAVGVMVVLIARGGVASRPGWELILGAAVGALLGALVGAGRARSAEEA